MPTFWKPRDWAAVPFLLVAAALCAGQAPLPELVTDQETELRQAVYSELGGKSGIIEFSPLYNSLRPIAAPPQPQPATSSEPQEHSTQTPAALQPFALNAIPLTAGKVLDKWNELAAEVRSESEILARCRSDAAHCPAAAKKFLDVIADGRAHDGRARIGVINRDINLAIRPTSDLAQWGVTDRWSAPLATLASGRGDCEDYAIAKYVALREAGLPESDVRLVIVRDLASGADHAVAAARIDETWIMLDNRRLILTQDRAMARVVPLFEMDDTGVRRFTTSVAELERAPAPSALRR
jgi:predicted transglutaminase-like cysteine proteinase